MRTKNSILSFVVLGLSLLSLSGSPAQASHKPGSAPTEERIESAAAGSNCFRYGDVVTFRFNMNNSFMTAADIGPAKINQTTASPSARFLLLDPANASNAGYIPQGGKFALRTYRYNNYLRADGSGTVKSDSRSLNQDGIWTLLSSNPCGVATGGVKVTGFLMPDGQGRFVEPSSGLAVTLPNQWVTSGWDVEMAEIDWTGFYYDIPWEPTAQKCPYRGRWDGANCFVAASPYPHPFVWNNNFYADGVACGVLGWYDGAHCQIGVNPAWSQTAFIYKGSWYLKAGFSLPPPPPPPPPVIPTQTSCIDDTTGSLYGVFQGCGKPSAIEVGAYPMKPNYSTFPMVQQTVPLSDVLYFRVCYKKTWTLQSICNNELTYSGGWTRNITGLMSGKTYKVQAYWRDKTTLNEYPIGQIKVSTH